MALLLKGEFTHTWLKRNPNCKTRYGYNTAPQRQPLLLNIVSFFLGMFYAVGIYKYMYICCAQALRSCPTLCDPLDRSPPGSSVRGILQAGILEWVAIPFSRGSSRPRDRTQVSRMQADSLPAEPLGKPKSTGVGSLSLLQGIIPTQESNRGLLHCRQILYQLSYQGSPKVNPRQRFLMIESMKWQV